MNHSPREPEFTPWPEKCLKDWAIALSLFLFSVVFLWPFRNYSQLFGDEGIFLQGAQRILDGEIPYRDFFTYFTPGSYYWIALRFKIFGTSLFAGRVMLLVYGGIISVAIYMLARRTCSRPVAALLAYLFLMAGLPYRFVVLHNWDSTVWALLALYAAVVWLQSSRWGWAFTTGFFVALCCLFDQPKGAGLMVGIGLGLFLINRWSPARSALSRRNLLAAATGLVLPAAVAFAYFASKHSLGAMIQDCLWPLAHVGSYSNVNRLPYGYIPISFESWELTYGSGPLIARLFFVFLTSPFFIIPALPVLAAALLIVSIHRMKRAQSGQTIDAHSVLVAACGLGQVLGAIATGRPEVDHLIYVAPPLFLVLGSVWGTGSFAPGFSPRVRIASMAFCLVTFSGFGVRLLVAGPLNPANRTLETRRGPVLIPRRDGVIPFIELQVPAGRKIFVYPYQPLYYFLTNINNSTQFDYLHLGLHAPEHMARAITELTVNRTETVLFAPAFNSQVLPQVFPATPQRVLDSDPLRDFLYRDYRSCGTLPSLDWPYVVLRRRDLPCFPDHVGIPSSR